MNCLEATRTDIKILNLLDKLDESRNHHDISIAQGNQFAADLWLRRIMDLAKEIDNVIVTDAPAKLDF